jgi:hypothetical protein
MELVAIPRLFAPVAVKVFTIIINVSRVAPDVPSVAFNFPAVVVEFVSFVGANRAVRGK